MANTLIQNDKIYTFTIHVEDASGDLVPAIAGDVYTVVSSNPASLSAVVGTDAAGAPAVVVNALVAAGTDYTVTTSDSSGLKAATNVFDIVADTAPMALVLDLVDATTVAQPVPTAPGP